VRGEKRRINWELRVYGGKDRGEEEDYAIHMIGVVVLRAYLILSSLPFKLSITFLNSSVMPIVSLCIYHKYNIYTYTYQTLKTYLILSSLPFKLSITFLNSSLISNLCASNNIIMRSARFANQAVTSVKLYPLLTYIY
jgi:hypothetical protein